MRIDPWRCAVRLLSSRSIASALIGMCLAACQSPKGGYRPADPSVIRIPLIRSCDDKLLLRPIVPGGCAWMALDTGAPITCASASKGALFHFMPPPGNMPPTITMNGRQDRMALIPHMDFGGVTVKNIPAVPVDISRVTSPELRGFCDGILGLGELCRLHAVIDIASHSLFVHTKPVCGTIPTGWQAVPMNLVGGHLIIPGAINGVPAFFIVDTGAPETFIDTTASRSQGIPVKERYIYNMVAIHYQTKAGKIGRINNLRLGCVDIGPTPVCVIDIGWLINPRQQPTGATGLIGVHTLERLKAIIDLGAMQLYIKNPVAPK